MIADIWLVDLPITYPETARIAKRLLRMQVLVYESTGHIPVFLSEGHRRSAMLAARRGELPQVHIKCYRCGAWARVADWCELAERLRGTKAPPRKSHMDLLAPLASEYDEPCLGDVRLREAGAALSAVELAALE